MRSARAARALASTPSATPAPTSLFASSTSVAQATQATQALTVAKDHLASLAEQQNLSLALAQLAPSWTPLPTAPYPPGNDTSGFPRSGDLSLAINSSTVSQTQLLEPARVVQGLNDQALARRPKLTPLFWVGLACLGVGIYLAKK